MDSKKIDVEGNYGYYYRKYVEGYRSPTPNNPAKARKGKVESKSLFGRIIKVVATPFVCLYEMVNRIF